jgi:hypothetical protein
MKTLRSIALVLGSPMLIIGLGMVVVFSFISYNQGTFEMVPILVGIGLLASGWGLLMYASRSVGASILNTLLNLIG